jgi:hypothetical protein
MSSIRPFGQLVLLQIGQAGLGGDGEAGRHVEADLRHLAQIGALAAEQHLVLAVAFLEFVDELAGFHVGPAVEKNNARQCATAGGEKPCPDHGRRRKNPAGFHASIS